MSRYAWLTSDGVQSGTLEEYARDYVAREGDGIGGPVRCDFDNMELTECTFMRINDGEDETGATRLRFAVIRSSREGDDTATVVVPADA